MTSQDKRKVAIKNIVIIIIPMFIVVIAANIVFSNFHYSAMLDHVEKTESIMEKTKENLAIKTPVGGNLNCIRIGNVGRLYCGQNEWDLLVREKISSNLQNRKSELEFETYLFNTSSQFPFGGEFKNLKQVYGKHANAWINFITRLSACNNYECLYKQWNAPNEIKSTFEISRVEFSRAVPFIDFMDINKRVEKIFES